MSMGTDSWRMFSICIIYTETHILSTTALTYTKEITCYICYYPVCVRVYGMLLFVFHAYNCIWLKHLAHHLAALHLAHQKPHLSAHSSLARIWPDGESIIWFVIVNMGIIDHHRQSLSTWKSWIININMEHSWSQSLSTWVCFICVGIQSTRH
jgi:hypothetical protein